MLEYRGHSESGSKNRGYVTRVSLRWFWALQMSGIHHGPYTFCFLVPCPLYAQTIGTYNRLDLPPRPPGTSAAAVRETVRWGPHGDAQPTGIHNFKRSGNEKRCELV